MELIASGANVAQVADATIKAAEEAFSFVSNDAGYNRAVWLLTQISLAGNAVNPLEHLRGQGINIPDNTSLPGIISALSQALDNGKLRGKISDLGELAHRALVDAVITRMKPKLQQLPLFNLSAEDTRQALKEFRKEKEFAKLSREFYSRLTNETMSYFLSRTLATHLGDGQRFATTNQMSQFEDALATHCREASVIVEKYSGEWFSKHRYEEKGDISRESVQGFASWALKKMNDELRAGAKSHEL
ncbi:hypothetical protein [uncultured Rubinisphaera sp.]|uniref:hypothetical protein n=1 Tax=uncultured Rubinisphaera sp. TaxID=1678686 RepID=UPI0030DB18C3